MILENQWLKLRPLEASDQETLVKLANNHKIWLNTSDSFPHPYTQKDAKDYLEATKEENPILTFAIIYQNQFAGIIGFKKQDNLYRKSLEIGYWTGEPFWGKNITPQAVELITPYGFSLGYNRIFGCVYEYNPASMRVLEKAGYQKEGVARKAVFKNNACWDEHRYARLNTD